MKSLLPYAVLLISLAVTTALVMVVANAAGYPLGWRTAAPLASFTVTGVLLGWAATEWVRRRRSR
ncbi:hypothetical protein [Micromonospora chalcea]|uniref:hypothetical protein n=1 Tax=Micromonospora chalcea TaxID=1874 RepID=UPI003D73606C